MKKNILLLSGKNILELPSLHICSIIKIVENTLKEYAQGNISLYHKISHVFNESNQSRINCLTAALPRDNICGMKWVSVFPDNPRKYGLRNSHSTVLLSGLADGYPIALLDFTLGTALRTAAVNGLATLFLAKQDSKVLGIIGSGVQAKINFQAIKYLYPQIELCYISSRGGGEIQLADSLMKVYPDVQFRCCEGKHYIASENADIVITATSAQKPLLKAEYVREGTLYLHTAGYEDEYAVALKANKIVCDSWEAVKHRSQTLSKMYHENYINDSDIYADLWEIVVGQKKGRVSEKEFIYFNSVGLPYLDVAIAKAMYDIAKAENIGTWMEIDDIDVFECAVVDKLML